MFDTHDGVREADLPRDAVGCSAALRAGFLEERRAVAQRLRLVAHWADLHAPCEEGTRDGRPGHRGTPVVTAFAATELGVLLELTTGSARSLLRDVLDLRHRHPVLWRALLEGRVAEWVARRVVRATAEAELTLEQARWVDERTGEAVCRLPFTRAMALVHARIIEVDREAAETRRRAALERRQVTLGGSNCFGLRTLTAHTDGVDLARVDGMLDVLAQALADRGDPDPREVRRAKALGVLANPAAACMLLATSAPDGEGDPASPEVPPGREADFAAAFGRTLLELGPSALDRLRPTSVLYYHLAAEALDGERLTAEVDPPVRTGHVCAVGRSERDGPLTVPQLRSWLEGERVVVRPVLDPSGVAPVDAYEVPDRMREALTLTRPVEVFPWGTLPSRAADADHTVPYRSPARGGPPGQTRLTNLGPLGRSHHNAKTLGGWQLHQPQAGVYLWRTPTGHWARVDATGTAYSGSRRPEELDVALSPGERRLARMLDDPVLTG